MSDTKEASRLMFRVVKENVSPLRVECSIWPFCT